MSECELCGSKNADRRTKIDNAILNVCKGCVGFGQEIPAVEEVQSRKTLFDVPGLSIPTSMQS